MLARALFSLACVTLATCAATPDISVAPTNADKSWFYHCKSVSGGATKEYYEQLNITKSFEINQKSLTIDIPKVAPSNNAYLVGLKVSVCSTFGTKYSVQVTYYRESPLPIGIGHVIVMHLDDNLWELPLGVKVTAYYNSYDIPLMDTFLGYLSNMDD